MAEELTPEQKALQEEIRKKVDWLKFCRRHLRLAGIAVQLVGIFVSNTTLLLLGTVVFAYSYLFSVSIMEDINLLIWDHPHDEPKNEEDETPQ